MLLFWGGGGEGENITVSNIMKHAGTSLENLNLEVGGIPCASLCFHFLALPISSYTNWLKHFDASVSLNLQEQASPLDGIVSGALLQTESIFNFPMSLIIVTLLFRPQNKIQEGGVLRFGSVPIPRLFLWASCIVPLYLLKKSTILFALFSVCFFFFYSQFFIFSLFFRNLCGCTDIDAGVWRYGGEGRGTARPNKCNSPHPTHGDTSQR